MTEARRRLIAACAVCALGSAISFFVTPSDFAQDYLAAAAVHNGIDPNTPSLALAERFGLSPRLVTSIQTAHPPLVTGLSLPFAALPWAEARAAWQLSLCLVTAALLAYANVPSIRVLLLSPAWVFGLGLGNVDALVVCLCLIALKPQSRATAFCVGLATSLKVYPALLLLGLFATRRYREALLAALIGGVTTTGAAALIGFDSLIGWLQFIPKNGEVFAANMMNLSLSKVAALAGIPTYVVTSLGFLAVALLFRRNTIEPLLPAIILVSPLSWVQSLPLLSNLLTKRELALYFAFSAVIVASWFSGLRWTAYFGVIASFLLTIAIAIVYHRRAKAHDEE